MEVCVERGRGYVPAEKREPEALPTEEGEAEPCELLPRAEINETLFRNVDELELSVRASNCLKTAEHPGDRRSRAEDRGGAPEDQELRQEIAERDQDDPG